MRKFTTLVLMSLSLAVSAQDIIVTRDNKRIDANITEVSGDNIRYKKANSPDGPVFVMPVKDINSIVYKNGDVQTFEETAATQSQPAAVSATPAPITASTAASEPIVYKALEFKGDVLPEIEYKKAVVPGKKKMKKRYCGGNMVLNKREFKIFLQRNCPEAYKELKKAQTLNIIGSSITVVGCLSSAFIPIPTCLAAIGGGCALSLAFFLPAAHYESQVLDTYNATCAGTPVKKQ
ncbi:MAG: hypothetical protein II129_00560 [Paludibacteraceae bacterium]|nr:hypothetical protein [Paludibacteraceae bacterium]